MMTTMNLRMNRVRLKQGPSSVIYMKRIINKRIRLHAIVRVAFLSGSALRSLSECWYMVNHFSLACVFTDYRT